MNDKDLLLAQDWSRHADAIEVHAMQVWVSSDGIECAESADESDRPDRYSIFFHLKGGGLEHCRDFVDYEKAIAFANAVATIHNSSVYDFAKPFWSGQSSYQPILTALQFFSSSKAYVTYEPAGGSVRTVQLLTEERFEFTQIRVFS